MAASRALCLALLAAVWLAGCGAAAGGSPTATPIPPPVPTRTPATARTPTPMSLATRLAAGQLPPGAPARTSTGDELLAVFAEAGLGAAGLPLRQIAAVAVAADGELWLATGGSEPRLLRFDGSAWREETASPLPAQVLARGPDGALWAAAGCDAARYSAGRWELAAPCGQNTGRAHAIDFGPQGSVWLTTDFALHRIDAQGRRAFDGFYPLRAAITPDGAAWVTRSPLDPADPGLVAIDPSGATRDVTSQLQLQNPLALAAAPDGTLWVGGTGGAASFDGRTWRVYPIDGRAAELRVHELAVAPDGDLWAISGDAPVGSGLARFDGDRWELHDPGAAAVGGLTFAPDGSLWLTTEAGVVHLRPAQRR